MPSVIEICNLALAHIAQGSINALDERSPQAKTCNLFYKNSRDAFLRQFPWNFSTKTILLAQVATDTPGWGYTYQYPPSALWVREVFNTNDVIPDVPNEYEIAGTGTEKFICCDVYQAYAKCTIKIDDTSLFDPSFVEAFSLKLAMDLCMPLTNSSTKTQELMTKLQQSMSNAALAGAVEGAKKKTATQRERPNNSWVRARW